MWRGDNEENQGPRVKSEGSSSGSRLRQSRWQTDKQLLQSAYQAEFWALLCVCAPVCLSMVCMHVSASMWLRTHA